MQSLASFIEQQFVEPEWDAPLDTVSAVQALPVTSTLSGMFFEATIAAARKARIPLSSQWSGQYHTFRFYPMRDFARLLAEFAPLLLPEKSIRQALRIMGRSTPDVLLGSTVGKVVLGSAEGVHEIIDTVSKTYPINLKPSKAEIVERADEQVVVRLSDVHYFMDCHHVGIMEGTLRYAGVKGSVRIRRLGPGAMDYLLSW